MGNPDDELPTYEEVIRQDTNQAPPQPQRPQGSPYQGQAPLQPPRPVNPPMPQRPPQRPPPPQQHSRIPWVYPVGYYCKKCGNTGYKVKNGHPCKTCWRTFARNTHVNVQPIVSPPIFQGNYGAPVYVSPGDPRIGGYCCAECKGLSLIHI